MKQRKFKGIISNRGIVFYADYISVESTKVNAYQNGVLVFSDDSVPVGALRVEILD